MRYHVSQTHFCNECIHHLLHDGMERCTNPRSIFEGTALSYNQTACENLEVYSCYSMLPHLKPPVRKNRKKITCMADME